MCESGICVVGRDTSRPYIVAPHFARCGWNFAPLGQIMLSFVVYVVFINIAADATRRVVVFFNIAADATRRVPTIGSIYA
jgi:hypothetical protein